MQVTDLIQEAPQQLGELLTIAEACEHAARFANALPGTDVVTLSRASGRALAEDLWAVRSCPSFDQSAMDGYVLPARECLLPGTRIPVRGRIAAGHEGSALPQDLAARIFTGAPIPAGAGAVVMQEHVVREGDSIVLRRPVPPGDHIRRRGEDVAPGDLLAMTGQRLDPRHVALLAAQGIATVRVRRRPRVAIVSTGDELLPAGGTCGSASVYDTNRPMLMGLAAGAGLDIADYGCAPDDPEALADVLRAAAAACDLVVTSGGVSVGEEDHSSRALERAGGTGESLRIGMKPGKPALVGRIGAAVYLGLPGNPVSALVSWSLLGRAIIAALEGRRFAPPLGLPVALEGALLRKSGRTEFMPARLAWHDSEPRLQILPGGSARLRPLAEADGFAEVPAHVSTAAAGSTLAFHPFEKLFAP